MNATNWITTKFRSWSHEAKRRGRDVTIHLDDEGSPWHTLRMHVQSKQEQEQIIIEMSYEEACDLRDRLVRRCADRCASVRS